MYENLTAYLAKNVDSKLTIADEDGQFCGVVQRRDDGAIEFEAYGATVTAALDGLEPLAGEALASEEDV